MLIRHPNPPIKTRWTEINMTIDDSYSTLRDPDDLRPVFIVQFLYLYEYRPDGGST